MRVLENTILLIGIWCLKQEYGGLGIQNIREFNMCPLASLVKRYNISENKIWRKIVDFKYDMSPKIMWANPTQCSPFWKGVAWAANAIQMGYRWKVGKGLKVKFWEDVWLGNCSLAIFLLESLCDCQ
jgi:hypothetical protein